MTCNRTFLTPSTCISLCYVCICNKIIAHSDTIKTLSILHYFSFFNSRNCVFFSYSRLFSSHQSTRYFFSFELCVETWVFWKNAALAACCWYGIAALPTQWMHFFVCCKPFNKFQIFLLNVTYLRFNFD